MKKFFWLVVIVLLFASFSDSSLIKPYRDQLYELVQDKISSAADSKEAALRHTRKELLALSEQWGESQRAYLDNASQSVASLQRLRRDYCVNKDFNPILFGEPLQQVCAVLEKNYHHLNNPK